MGFMGFRVCYIRSKELLCNTGLSNSNSHFKFPFREVWTGGHQLLLHKVLTISFPLLISIGFAKGIVSNEMKWSVWDYGVSL